MSAHSAGVGVQSQFSSLTVVIVTYNSAHCIESLSASLKGLPHVIVIDNASHDDTRLQVQRSLPQAQIIQNSTNLGFGHANNLGFAKVQTPYLLMLNPDCQIALDDMAILLNFLQSNAHTAVVAPQLLLPSGKVQIDYRWPRHLWTSRGPAAQGPCSVGFVCGAAVMARTAVLTEVGGFDERFFLYYEDEDLFRRLFERRQSIVLVPEAKAIHAARGSVRGSKPWRSEYLRGYHHAASKLIYHGKWHSAKAADRLAMRVLGAAVVGLPLRLLWPAPKYVARWLGRVQAAWHAIRQR